MKNLKAFKENDLADRLTETTVGIKSLFSFLIFNNYYYKYLFREY